MDSNPHIAREIRRLEEQYSFRPDSLVFGRLAELHRKAGNPERALEILDEGLSRHPRYLSAHLVRARCLRALDRRESAREAFEDVVRLDDQNPVALRSLAELAFEREDREEARRHLEALLRVDPGSDEAREMLEEVAREEDRGPAENPGPAEEPGPTEPAAAGPEEAAELREQVDELDLSAPEREGGDEDLATETLAGLYETQGFYREAVEMYERLLEERPESEEIRQRLERARAALDEAAGRPSAGEPTAVDHVEVEGSPEEGRPSAEETAAQTPTVSAAEHLRALLGGEARAEDTANGTARSAGRPGGEPGGRG